MSKKILIISGLGICLIVGFLLFTFTTNKSDNKNGFERHFFNQQARLNGKLQLDNDTYSISDFSLNAVTLFKYRSPFMITKTASSLENRRELVLPFPSDKEKINGMNTMSFRPNGLYLLTGKNSTAYKLTSDILTSSKLNKSPFYQSEVINSNSFLFISREVREGEYRMMLKKVNWNGEIQNYYLPKKQIDGYICTDGQFKYDQTSNRLTYMYYYRGEFDCLDSNLNVVYNAKTIDTVKYAKLHFQKKNNKNFLTSPPNVVNRNISIANGRIYIQSNLKADNETINDFKKSEVIDVYNLSNGKYSASFYLPRFNRQRLTEFRIYQNTILALYTNYLAVFEIPAT